MYSHVINPNHFVIEKDSFIIPFGIRCPSALVCKFASIRKCSLPFDWVMPLFPNIIQKILENNFENFIPDVHNSIFHNKYDITLTHFNQNIDAGIEEYTRRIERFNNIVNQSKHIYFIFINEDYLYDEKYREDNFNNTMFDEMLELEQFMKKKYTTMNYHILYFNFKHHTVPADSNIINIELHTTTYGTNYIEEFRLYCAQILAELFNSTLTLGYSEAIFHN
jgi:hypothetical protein